MADNDVRLASNGTIARLAIYPQAMRQDGESLVFDEKQLLSLGSDKVIGGRKHRFLSVADRGKLPEAADVHDYGCRTAANRNKKNAARIEEDPKRKNYYLGFYEALVVDIEACSDNIYEIYVVGHEEDGEAAHCNLTLREREEAKELPDKATARTQIIIKLWRAMFGPQRHVCEADNEVRAKLEAIELEQKDRQPLGTFPE